MSNIQYNHHLNDGYAIDGVMLFVRRTEKHPSCSRVEITANEQELLDYLNSIGSSVAEFVLNSNVRTRIFNVESKDLVDTRGEEVIIIEVRQNNKEQVAFEFNSRTGQFEVPLVEVPATGEVESEKQVKNKGYNINILYNLNQKTKSKVEEITKKILSLKFEEKAEEICRLNLVVNYGGSLDLQAFNINPPQLDLSLNYGQEFKEKHDYLISKIEDSKSNKGLVLLHGEPGCGKTYYIRYLVKMLSKKKNVIYIPPDLAHEIASPHFLAFLLENPGSILVIEDAENIIRSRKSGQNQAVANLLNTTDGLLADCLRVQVVCTFNCPYEDVDDALKRKGRLIVEHKFNKLKKEQAQLVAKSLGLDLPITKDMTLAEIYNHKDLDFQQEQKTKIGFNI